MPFLGSEDPKRHMKAFRDQMIILEGSDVICCKMLVGTLTDLQLFSGVSDGKIVSFQEFSNMFKEQF